MTTNPKITSTRDTLADEYCSDWLNECDCVEESCGKVKPAFKAGWDKCESLLKEDNRKLVEALKVIAEIKYGLDLNDSDEDQRAYWVRLATWYEKLAREALREFEETK